MKYLIATILVTLTISAFAQEAKPPAEQDEVLPMSMNLRPKILYRERAKYTQEALDKKVEGVVVLDLTYSKDATIKDIKVVKGLPDGLTESAIASAKKIRFEPAEKDGKPVSVRGKVEFQFKL